MRVIIYFGSFNMAASNSALVLVLAELMDSEDEKPRRGKTRDWIKRRKESGYFQNIFQELKLEDRIGFRDMFRMSVGDYEYILSQISDLISTENRACGNKPIEPDERLALTLRYLATGESFKSLSYQFRISLAAVSYIIKGCCRAINERLQHIFIKVPDSSAKWQQISEKFEQRWNYPHALGAIDGKHVRIVKPDNGGSYYYNYKHTHSIILLAIAGPDYECLYADIGSNGRVNDSGIWNKCSLLQGIEDGSIKLPDDDYLMDECKMPYVFLGDDAFALKNFMMKPYPQQNLSADKRIYNYRHSRARRISENLFGILANRWRIYFTIINLEPEIVKDIALSTLILHNMLLKSHSSTNAYRPTSLTDYVNSNGEITEGEWRRDVITGDTFYPLQVPRSGHNAKASAKGIRDNFKDYFVTDGAVSWQWKYC